MSRSPELPDDLERLGDHLEAAVAVAVRRRSRRQAVMSFVGAVVIAVPFAVAGAATSVSPGLSPVPRPVEPVQTAAPAVVSDRPVSGHMVRSVPAASVAPRPSQPCLDTKACRVPVNPAFRPQRQGTY